MKKKKIFSRRQFLKSVGKLGAGAIAIPYIIPSSALGSGKLAAPSERINIAHIGTGNQGSVLMKSFVGLETAQYVAVCDPFESKRNQWAQYINDSYANARGKASYNDCQAYGDFREIISRKDIDAVIVSTPDHWHVPIGLAAARAGKDMYIEKPLSTSIAEDKIMRETIKRYGNIFQYGTQQRSSWHCRYGCELVRNGRIGEIKRIEVLAPGNKGGGSTKPVKIPDGFDYDMWLGSAPESPYTTDRCTTEGSWFVYDNSLGFIAGWGAHPLDILDWGYGSDNSVPVEYEGTGVIPTEGLFNTITSWNIRCRYANGVEMTFKEGPDCTKFIGTEGWIAISRSSISAEPKSLLNSTIRPDEIHLVTSKNHYQNFIDCVRSRQQPVSPVESAVRSDTISQLSDIAVRSGQIVKWDPSEEKIINNDLLNRLLSRPMRSPWHL